MQGRKTYQEKLFANFQLSERLPLENFIVLYGRFSFRLFVSNDQNLLRKQQTKKYRPLKKTIQHTHFLI
jgi:hypothetical protein